MVNLSATAAAAVSRRRRRRNNKCLCHVFGKLLTRDDNRLAYPPLNGILSSRIFGIVLVEPEPTKHVGRPVGRVVQSRFIMIKIGGRSERANIGRPATCRRSKEFSCEPGAALLSLYILDIKKREAIFLPCEIRALERRSCCAQVVASSFNRKDNRQSSPIDHDLSARRRQ